MCEFLDIGICMSAHTMTYLREETKKKIFYVLPAHDESIKFRRRIILIHQKFILMGEKMQTG